MCDLGVCVPAQCGNGVDDDVDGRVDYPMDPGCMTPEDDDETDPTPPPECADGLDNDSDGRFDYPADPGLCESAADTAEQSTPDCRDGLDNDDDGLIDLDDPGVSEIRTETMNTTRRPAETDVMMMAMVHRTTPVTRAASASTTPTRQIPRNPLNVTTRSTTMKTVSSITPTTPEAALQPAMQPKITPVCDESSATSLVKPAAW